VRDLHHSQVMSHRRSSVRPTTELPNTRTLAVCAHPDDESFGLGAALAAFGASGAAMTVLSLTRGEASPLGTQGLDLRRVRSAELAAATRVLGVRRLVVFDHADSGLFDVPVEVLVREISVLVDDTRPDLLPVFDEAGVTGHPDHRRATEAAVEAAEIFGLPVLAWTILHEVATKLNDELGVSFVGRPATEIDVEVIVDRTVQRDAIACHATQSLDNPVLWRRLELEGDIERFCWLRRAARTAPLAPQSRAGRMPPADAHQRPEEAR